jgi:hypothetical protein
MVLHLAPPDSEVSCFLLFFTIADVPQPLLGHRVINRQLRPSWPAHLKANPDWQGLLQLADLCWCHDPHMRCVRQTWHVFVVS